MSRHDDATSLRHMLEYGREAVGLLGDKTLDELRDDRMLQLSIARLLEIVGEAASRLSSKFRTAHPEVPWREIAGMRNRLAHVYDNINLGVVWRTAKEDMPRLLETLERITR